MSSLSNLDHIVASALDFHIKSDAFTQTIQSKPLLGLMEKRKQTFPGGKGEISLPITFQENLPAIQGFDAADTVSYSNPQNTRRISFPWKEIHAGISLTLTELKIDGISVSDSMTGESTTKHSNRDATVLTNILKAKLDDMTEGWARSFNEMLWLDGSQDNKVVPGIMNLIRPGANIGLVGGVNLNLTGNTGGFARSTAINGTNFWANREDVFVYQTGKTNIIDGLRREIRQLSRFGGKPTTILCGSQFLNYLEQEVHSKGLYTQNNAFTGGTTVGMGAISLLGIGEFVYDPTLDSLPRHDGTGNQSDMCYLIDTEALQLHVMDGEDKKTHNPARPEDKYVIYKAMTWTGGLATKRLTSSGLYRAVD